MKTRKGVSFVLLVSGVALGLSAVSFSLSAGRPMDQALSERTIRVEPAGQTYLPGYLYIGRRVDQPQVIVARRTVEQAELARFEEGHPAAPRHAEYPYIGRRVDALH